MNGFTTRDFASLLDDLLARAEEGKDEFVANPSVSFGFVTPDAAVEALWKSVPTDFVAKVYGEAADRESLDAAPGIETPEPAPLPSVEPDDIAAELRMANARWPRDFDRIRREFARQNHPDRVEAHLRERAVTRMQIANMMIDREKRKAAARGA
jgi:hypothetical protein